MKKPSKAESSEEICSENVNYEYSDSQNDIEVEPDIIHINGSELEDDDLASDDSDAPVDISWKDSKAVFQQDEKDRISAVNLARSVDKEKRRKKNEMYVSQKEAKRKFELTKLPEDIVQAVAIKKPKTLEQDGIKEGSDKKLERKSRKSKNKEKLKKTDEYCHVVVLEEEVKKPKKVQESAAEFLKNHLYGNRLKRTSGATQLTMQCKSSGSMKPAVKFSTKT